MHVMVEVLTTRVLLLFENKNVFKKTPTCVFWWRHVWHFVCIGTSDTSWLVGSGQEVNAETPLRKTSSHNRCQSQAGPVLTQSCPMAYSIGSSTSLIFPPASQSSMLCGYWHTVCESVMGEIISEYLFGFSGMMLSSVKGLPKYTILLR